MFGAAKFLKELWGSQDPKQPSTLIDVLLILAILLIIVGV